MGRVTLLGRHLDGDPAKEGDVLEGTRGGSRGGSVLGIHEDQKSRSRTQSSGRTRFTMYATRRPGIYINRPLAHRQEDFHNPQALGERTIERDTNLVT